MNPWEWIPRNAGQLAEATLDHLVLTALAVGGGLAISFALALAIRADRRWYGPLTGGPARCTRFRASPCSRCWFR